MKGCVHTNQTMFMPDMRFKGTERVVYENKYLGKTWHMKNEAEIFRNVFK